MCKRSIVTQQHSAAPAAAAYKSVNERQDRFNWHASLCQSRRVSSWRRLPPIRVPATGSAQLRAAPPRPFLDQAPTYPPPTRQSHRRRPFLRGVLKEMRFRSIIAARTPPLLQPERFLPFQPIGSRSPPSGSATLLPPDRPDPPPRRAHHARDRALVLETLWSWRDARVRITNITG